MAKIYRPVLRTDEIDMLSDLLKQTYLDHLSKPPYNPDMPRDTARGYSLARESILVSLIGKISTLQNKIENSAIVPAYDTTPKASLEESLGMPATPAPELVTNKEAYWEQCYLKYVANPGSCTVAEILAAQEHRYLNGLMTPEEVSAFEDKLIGNSGATF